MHWHRFVIIVVGVVGSCPAARHCHAEPLVEHLGAVDAEDRRLRRQRVAELDEAVPARRAGHVVDDDAGGQDVPVRREERAQVLVVDGGGDVVDDEIARIRHFLLIVDC